MFKKMFPFYFSCGVFRKYLHVSFLKENKTLKMKDIKDALLYLGSFDENNMFDLEQNVQMSFVSDVLRILKNGLKNCEDAIFDLIDLTVKITDMVVLKKPVYYKKLKNCLMLCYNTKMIVIEQIR